MDLLQKLHQMKPPNKTPKTNSLGEFHESFKTMPTKRPLPILLRYNISGPSGGTSFKYLKLFKVGRPKVLATVKGQLCKA